jgi:glycosyltransferase involved in cell wall biosynthesis
MDGFEPAADQQAENPDPNLGKSAPPIPAETERHALVVSSLYADDEMPDQIGREAYSYRFVYRSFAPLLQRWGSTEEITRAESRLDYAVKRLRRQKLDPIHLSFLPLHLTYLTRHTANVAFPFWEFPDLPDRNFGSNPRHNWVQVAERLKLVLTASNFTRDTFLRAGVETPVRVVPVPIPEAYFDVPSWQRGQETILETPCYVVPQPEAVPGVARNPWLPLRWSDLRPRARLGRVYKSYIKPRMPSRLDRYLTAAVHAAAAVHAERRQDVRVNHPVTPRLELTGIVYTAIFNPFDPRKNWQDLISAFLLALCDQEDATLVLKLVVCRKLAPHAVNAVLEFRRRLGIKHKCKLALVPAYLSDAEMVDLTRGSTYHVNTARAEGACLPLQDFLAAQRPGIAPVHTAMSDYFGDNLGFVVDSQLEPACWPHDPEQRMSTRWHRLVWESLHDQLRSSYLVAKQNQDTYQMLAMNGRERMLDFASAETVWPRLLAALNSVGESPEPQPADRITEAEPVER